MSGFRELRAWQDAYALCRAVYECTSGFPRSEMMALGLQMRRAVVSIPSNIAEGYGRRTRTDYVHYLHLSRGSLYELDTQVSLAHDLKYLTPEQWETLNTQIIGLRRELAALIRSLSEKPI